MPRHQETRILPYPQEDLFKMVLDVNKYPEFLPWCQGVRIYKEQENLFFADLIIGFRLFKERFTSKVTSTEPTEIHVDYVKGPLKYLHNDWKFKKIEGWTEIEFIVDFEFKNPIFQKLVGALFEEAVTKMVNAFEERSKSLYDKKL